MNLRRSSLQDMARVDPLSFFGQEIKNYLNVQNIKLQLVKFDAVTADEYEEINGEECTKYPRKAAEKVWSIVRRKKDGLERLRRALEENVDSGDCHAGHGELLKVLGGPTYAFDTIKSLFSSAVPSKGYELDHAVNFLVKITLSQGVHLVNSSLLQGTRDWQILFSQLERFHLCHCYDTDLLEHLLEAIGGDSEVEIAQTIRRRLVSIKSANLLVADSKFASQPAPGCFSLSVAVSREGLLMTRDLVEYKKQIREEFTIPLFSFQFIGVIQGVLYYQIPLHFLERVQTRLLSGHSDHVHLQKAGITSFTIRSDCIFEEYHIEPENYTHHHIVSPYTAVYTPLKCDPLTDSKKLLSRNPPSPRMRLAVSQRNSDKDKENKTKPSASHSISHSSIEPNIFRERISASWSPQMSKTLVHKHEHTLNFVMLGPEKVGKRTILNCFANSTVQESSTPGSNGIDVQHKIIPWNAFAQVKICVWKIPGSMPKYENYRDHPFMTSANAFIFVGDLTKSRLEDSLVKIKELKTKILPSIVLRRSKPHIPIVLVMNKMDGSNGGGLKGAEKKVVDRFVEEHKFTQMFLTSAKLDLGIKEMFECISAVILNSDAESVQFKTKS